MGLLVSIRTFVPGKKTCWAARVSRPETCSATRQSNPHITISAAGPLCHYCSTGPCDDKDSEAECLCVPSSGDLSRAVNDYLNDNSTLAGVARTYGSEIGNWCIKDVTSLDSLFDYAYSFNEDLSGWDTSKVTSMVRTFRHASSFNRDISMWNVSSVSKTTEMFAEAQSFNQPLNSWVCFPP